MSRRRLASILARTGIIWSILAHWNSGVLRQKVKRLTLNWTFEKLLRRMNVHLTQEFVRTDCLPSFDEGSELQLGTNLKNGYYKKNRRKLPDWNKRAVPIRYDFARNRSGLAYEPMLLLRL